MSTALKRPTVDDYFAADLADEHKLEFIGGEIIGGEIIAMAGGDPVHSRLAQKLGAILERGLAGAPCLTFQSDLRVQIGDDMGDYVYPDATIACPPRRFLDTRPRTLATPTIVFEVLSPSTAARDLNEKAVAYRRTPSLREYVMIDSMTRRVTHAVRTDDETWTVRDYVGEATFTLPTVGVQIPLGELYQGFEALRAELADAAPTSPAPAG